MLSYKIYTGGALPLSNQRIAVAVHIPGSPDLSILAPTKVQAFLAAGAHAPEKPHYRSAEGQVGTLPSTRVGKQSLKTYLEANGFELAKDSDPVAQKLADHLDVVHGAQLISRASSQWAETVANDYAEVPLELVPFDPEKSVAQVQLSPTASRLLVAHLDKGLNLAGVCVSRTQELGDVIDVSTGWLRPQGVTTPAPRATEYGGNVELACWLLCSLGLLELPAAPHLKMNEAEELYPRGVLRMRVLDDMLATDDTLVVGVSATDSLVVSYLRDGAELYRRETFAGVRLGDTLAEIAAVLVHVNSTVPVVSKKLVSQYERAWAAAFKQSNPFQQLRTMSAVETQCVTAGLRAVLPALRAAAGQPVSDKVLDVFGRAWASAFRTLAPGQPFARDAAAEQCVKTALFDVACSKGLQP